MPSHARPNVLLIVADDHAPAALSAYGSRLNQTPNLDRIAAGGLKADRCYCTNAICTPARATILTGTYSHVNGVKTLSDTIDQTQQTTLAMNLRDAGYQTAMIGKWHLGHGGASDPAGFDHWSVLPEQGKYLDPEFLQAEGRKQYDGYVTDAITDQSLTWLKGRDPERPFFLMCAHKAPHDPFTPPPRHAQDFADVDLPEPPTFHDDHVGRPAAAMSTQRVDQMHLRGHVPDPPPEGLTDKQRKSWNYQSFMRNYLRCVAGIDDSVGTLLDYLDEQGIADDTIVVYTADHGFFLGDHGWYDKRFMYEPSIRIPLLIRYPRLIQPDTSFPEMVLNVDFAPTLLEICGVEAPPAMQGRSILPLLRGRAKGWRTSMYYRYWMHLTHFNVPAHYGVRTDRYKLIYYYGQSLGCAGTIDQPTPPTWELFDLEADPEEVQNVYDDPAYARVVVTLKQELERLRQSLGDDA